MKPFRVYLFRFVGVITVSLLLEGCMLCIKSEDIPTLATGSPLKSVRPKTFVFKEFKDVRGTDVYLVGIVKLDSPASTIVSMSIRKELERNGHKCIVDSPQSKPDFIIEGTVYKYWLTHSIRFASDRYTGNVAVKLTVSRSSIDTDVLAKTYEGEYRRDLVIGGPSRVKGVLNQALLAMLKEISTDPELIAFLEK
jgi:hypothetical protein